MIYTKKEIYFKMSQDNVLSLNAFGEIIEPKGKRQYPAHSSPEPKVIQDVIPLTRVTPGEKPEFLPEPNSEEIKGRYTRGSKQANQVASKVLTWISQTKLLHWQTTSLAEHKALDELFEELVELGDTLVESVMGKYGRPELATEEATMTLVNYENPDSPDGLPRFLANSDNCFRNECAPLFSDKNDPEIHNIIQEILGKIDQISYLLTLIK